MILIMQKIRNGNRLAWGKLNFVAKLIFNYLFILLLFVFLFVLTFVYLCKYRLRVRNFHIIKKNGNTVLFSEIENKWTLNNNKRRQYGKEKFVVKAFSSYEKRTVNNGCEVKTEFQTGNPKKKEKWRERGREGKRRIFHGKRREH